MSAAETSPDLFMVTSLVDQARSVLASLGLPTKQTNERSALALLALLGLKPQAMEIHEDKAAQGWTSAQVLRLGITEIMDYMRDHLGKRYKPNTRETVRRQTIHQFVQAGLVLQNADDPRRPTNSPDNCYEIEPQAFALLSSYGTENWEPKLRAYLANVKPLAERYARERDMQRIPLQLPGGAAITLSPGGQNPLVEQILSEFCQRFTPGAKLVYVGDAAKKWAFFDKELLASVGVQIDQHGKMPDVVVLMETKGWLVLIEAVTSHGPMNEKRVIELRELCSGSTAGLVFVSAFPDRKTLGRFLNEIAWETEVWVAEDETHMIHFNGERFLGPHDL
jgi:hypothetical protein